MAIEYLKICDFTEVITGGTPSTKKSEYWGGTIPWLPSGVCQNCSVFDAKTFITQEGLDNSAAKMIPINSVLIALTGATAGKVAYLQMEATANQSVSAIVPSEKHIPKYLFYYLLYRRDKTLSDCYGGAQKHISQEYVKNIIVPLPSLEKQMRIACELDYANELIDKRKEQLRKLDELVKARFVELFGDPVVNEKGWDTKPLLEMGSCKNGMNFHYEDTGVEINCLGVGDFKDYSIISDTSILPTVSLNEMPSADYMLQDDDFVFVRSNGNKALVGRSIAVYPGDIPTTFSGFCIRYRKTDKAVNIPYLLRVLKTESVRQKMSGRGANIQNLNQQILGTLIIPVPPMELQNQFAAFVEQTDKSKLEVQKSLEKLELLKNALMQKYLG